MAALVLERRPRLRAFHGAPVRQPARRRRWRQRRRSTRGWACGRAFFAESVERIDEADRVEVGETSHRHGVAETPLKPDAEALAARNPALFERLEALGSLSARILVDRTGAVHRVRFVRDVDEDLRRPFLEVVEAARFDPSTYFDREPVVFELQVDYWINPQLPRVAYERGQPLVGDEVVEVGPLPGPGDVPGGGLPRYAAVLERGEPPVLDAGDEEWILSFMLSVDDRGNVVRATLLHDSRSGPFQIQSAPSPESEALTKYLQTFRLEPLVSRAPAIQVIDLRVSARGVEVATRAGDREELERRLAEAYRLPAGRNLDLRPQPHPPERTVLYRTGNPIPARLSPFSPDMMTIVWQGDRPAYRGSSFGRADMLSLVSILGVRRGAVRFEGGAENVRVAADVVMRDGASEEELIADLPQALEERLGLDLGVQVVSEPSRTLVLRGSVGTVALDDLYDIRPVLHIFADGRNEDLRAAPAVTFRMPPDWRTCCRTTSTCRSSTLRPGLPRSRSLYSFTTRPTRRSGWTC